MVILHNAERIDPDIGETYTASNGYRILKRLWYRSPGNVLKMVLEVSLTCLQGRSPRGAPAMAQ